MKQNKFLDSCLNFQFFLAHNRIGFNCGATIITTNHVLTAAHCVSSASLPATWSLKKVRLGEFNLDTDSDCEEINSIYYCGFPPVDIDIEKIFIHDQYHYVPQGNPHDIALIKLVETIKFNEFIKPICLALNDEVNTNYGTPTVAGYGRTETDEMSRVLKKAEVEIVNNRVCAAKYVAQRRTIVDTQLCASGTSTSDSW